MPIKQIIDAGKVPVKVYTDELDDASYEQLVNIAQLSIVYPHVAAMPDVHCGIGATVGSVIPTLHAIIPAAVGVDIGCGMCAIRLSLKANQLPDNLKSLRFKIEEQVPVGFDMHSEQNVPWVECDFFKNRVQTILNKHPQIRSIAKNIETRWMNQLGTLGGGNHFLEICVDEEDHVWIMCHSGSRGIGNAIGNYFIDLAKNDMKNHLANLPDKNLAYFKEGAQHFEDYIHAVNFAQDYALMNRKVMMTNTLAVLRKVLVPFDILNEVIDCHHNYVAFETHFGKQLFVTRKGAIRAKEGDLGIIPGSMGTYSYIVRGKGATESFHSCAHGAGRAMSRHQAKKRFNLGDLKAQTRGVECRKDKQVLDEIPSAYKNIEAVMKNQNDLVEVLYRLKQVICIKG